MASQVGTLVCQLSLGAEGKYQISVSNGAFVCLQHDLKVKDLTIALSQLKLINDGVVNDVDPVIYTGILFECLHSCDFSSIKEVEFLKFIQVLSLWISSVKINNIIKNEMRNDLIDYISDHYVETLEVLRSTHESDMNHDMNCPNNLLFHCSFISPLLITISFSFKLNYSKSKTLIKILSLVVLYQLNSKTVLFEELVKLFIVNDSTNIDMFDVFAKLWTKTLETSIDQDELDLKFFPGPISLLNRFEILKNLPMSIELIDQIIPFDSNMFLLKLSKDLVTVYSSFNRLRKDAAKPVIYETLSMVLSYVSTDYGCELVLNLITNLNMEKDFLSLQSGENQEYKPIVNYILFKLSHILNLNSNTITALTKSIMSADIIDVIESSDFARFKIFFDVVDQNLKTDYQSDLQLLLSLEFSLFYQLKQFDFKQHIDSLVELGSYFSTEAIQNNIGFILQNALLKSVNPKKQIPILFKKIISYRTFPPLPRSDYLDFQILDVNDKAQLNLKNFVRLFDCLQLNNSIIYKIIENEIVNQRQLGFINDLNVKDINMKFKTTDALLDQIFVTQFTNFLIVEELNIKSENLSNNSKLSSVLFDYRSLSNVLKLQTFEIFSKIFQLYDTFGVYKLIKFIDEISLQDLRLQKISISLLNHLYFHTNSGFKLQETTVKNQLIKKLLKEYILQWNEPSSSSFVYKEFNQFLEIDKSTLSRLQGSTNLDKSIILKTLGFNDSESNQINKLLNIVSPASSSSSTSLANFSSNNNYSNVTDPVTPTSANTSINSNGVQFVQTGNYTSNYSYGGRNNNNNQDYKSKNYNYSSSNACYNENLNTSRNARNIQPYIPSNQQQSDYFNTNKNIYTEINYGKNNQNDILRNDLNVLKTSYNVNQNLVHPQAISANNSSSNPLYNLEQYYST